MLCAFRDKETVLEDGWGGNKKMKKLIMICMMSIMFLGFTEIAQAVRPVKPDMKLPDEPFVKLSVKPDRLDLNNVRSMRRSSNSQGQLEAHIVANCPFQVKASFQPFRRVRGRLPIRPEHMSAEINGANVRVAGRAVPIITSMKPTGPGGVNFPLDIKLCLADASIYPAGSYKGNLVFTVTAATY
jgi:hypothetical protein